MLLAISVDEFILHMPDVLRVFLAVWLFAVGGCVGSFLNVVVLRMPAGIGIARSGSRCPVCLHPIRWYDNIPIVSWLVLRGRCRDCHTGISIRYPLVELLVAVVFLVLGLCEGLVSGRNLPLPPGAPRWFLLTGFQTWSLYTFHIITIVTLIGAALIERDKNAVPRRVFVPAVAVSLIAAVCFPWLHPVSVGMGIASEGLWGGVGHRAGGPGGRCPDGMYGMACDQQPATAAWCCTDSAHRGDALLGCVWGGKPSGRSWL